ncbi:DUF6457 domain-containing protein [Actinophytocola sp.]|jgi:hypothetical protein|uniref:DUF6457 domain-containing protein n=1 Tax=Actinophytocola sp. TaxID=1872138 RepID=UPI002ED8AF45
MDRLAQWTSTASAELGLDAAGIDGDKVFELARDVQRSVGRSAGTVGVYLLGMAMGRGMSEADAVARLTELAEQWSGHTCDWRD